MFRVRLLSSAFVQCSGAQRAAVCAASAPRAHIDLARGAARAYAARDPYRKQNSVKKRKNRAKAKKAGENNVASTVHVKHPFGSPLSNAGARLTPLSGGARGGSGGGGSGGSGAAASKGERTAHGEVIFECDRGRQFKILGFASAAQVVFWLLMAEMFYSNMTVKRTADELLAEQNALSAVDADADADADGSGSGSGGVNDTAARPTHSHLLAIQGEDGKTKQVSGNEEVVVRAPIVKRVAYASACVGVGSLFVLLTRWYSRHFVSKIAIQMHTKQVTFNTYSFFGKTQTKTMELSRIEPVVPKNDKQAKHWAQFAVEGYKTPYKLDVLSGEIYNQSLLQSFLKGELRR